MDVGSQMLIGGKSFSEVDWQSIKVSALEGAISGAIATATVGVSLAVTAGREGLKLTGKQIAKQAGKTMVIHGSSGMAINATSQAVVKGEVNASEVILSGTIDSVTGGIGRVLPHTGLGKAVKTFDDNVTEKAKGFTRGAFDNTRLVLGNERGSVGEGVSKISTPHGDALQKYSDDALNVKNYIDEGGDLYPRFSNTHDDVGKATPSAS
ncbi:MAG: hypothetical protein PHD60_11080 [Clostridia bacterium]|nr:hypothetical protein [Clostridia bacterium]